MNPDSIDKNYLVDLILDMGELMFASGAEVARVEDSMKRLGYAYGASDMSTFAITSNISVTAVFPDASTFTQTRRIRKTVNNFLRLEALNDLCRSCCASPVPLEELNARILKAKAMEPGEFKIYAGSILSCGAFAVFFGGNGWDGLVAAVLGGFLRFLQRKVGRFIPGDAFVNLLLSLLSGLVICAVCSVFPVLHSDMIMIGDIMLLIPGVAITCAVRDTLVGDTVSGALKLIESLVNAAAIAGGFMLAIMISRRFMVW